MRTPTWPVVLFDLDGTVANTIPLILESYGHATRHVLGEAASVEESRSWIGQTLHDTFAAKYPEHVDPLLAAYFDFNTAHLEKLIQRYPGIDELIVQLKDAGCVVGIVTSKRRAAAEATLRAVGLEGVIDLVGCLEDSTSHKPSGEPLVNALAKLSREAGDCVYVGDTTYDLGCAAAAGVEGVGVTWGAGFREQLETEPNVAIVDSVDALRDVLLPVPA